MERLEATVSVDDVWCAPLESHVDRHGLPPLGFLLIDAEGFDRAIVAALDLCVTAPQVLLFEHAYCDLPGNPGDGDAALANLQRGCPGRGVRYGALKTDGTNVTSDWAAPIRTLIGLSRGGAPVP